MEKRDGRSEKKLIRYKVEDGQAMCFCSAHNHFLPCDEFNRATYYEHGYDYRCKLCARLKKHSVYGSQEKKEKHIRNLLNAFYRSAGYDPESSIPIHEQFLIRHEL